MKFQESYVGSKTELAAFLKKVLSELLSDNLVVEGKEVSIPKDIQLEYKVKYDEDAEGGSVSIKASWENLMSGVQEEEAE